jgi:hypothetical protein
MHKYSSTLKFIRSYISYEGDNKVKVKKSQGKRSQRLKLLILRRYKMNKNVVSNYVDESVVVEIKTQKGTTFVVRGKLVWDNSEDDLNNDVTIFNDNEAISIDCNDIVNLKKDNNTGEKGEMIVPVIERILETGCKDVNEATQLVLKECQRKRIETNSKGYKVRDSNVGYLIKRILSDIRTGQGPMKWRQYKVVEDEQHLQIIGEDEDNESDLIEKDDKDESDYLTPAQVEWIHKECIKVAKNRDEVVYYSDLTDELNLNFELNLDLSNVNDRVHKLGKALDDINRAEKNKDPDAPMLTAVVVHRAGTRYGDSKIRMPGGGFFKLAKKWGRQKPNQSDIQFFGEELNKVYDHWAEEKNEVFQLTEESEPEYIWERISETVQEKREFLTIGERASFVAKLKTSKTITVTPSRGQGSHSVTYNETMKVLDRFKEMSPSERYKPGNYIDESGVPVYILRFFKIVFEGDYGDESKLVKE